MGDIPLSSFLGGAIAVIVLVSANAFFVAAEFGLVAARRTRLQTLAKQGDQKAKLASKAIQSLDRYISATQLGITLASLGLGWIGEPAVATFVVRLFEGLPNPFSLIATHATASVIAFALITILHIVLGELAPKAVALLHPETTSRWVAGPLMVFTVATNPFIWLLNGSANAILKLFGIRPASGTERVHQPEEILMIVEQTSRSGQLDTGDVRLIKGVFQFAKKLAREVMTPRTDVIGLDADLTVEEAAKLVADVGRSRYPVYGDSLDDIVGIVHAKEILANLQASRDRQISTIMRPQPLFVPGTRATDDLLRDMQRLKQHMAIVLDEYGGTAGVVTMEDLLEEIVGHIYDEYDEAQERAEKLGVATLPGNTEIDVANARYGFGIQTDQHQTVGGFVFGSLGRLPKVGDRVTLPSGTLEVAEMDGKRISSLKLLRVDENKEAREGASGTTSGASEPTPGGRT